MAPRMGPSTAVMATAIVVAHANRAVATAGGNPAAATALKNGGNTAVMIVDWKEEFAQSYIAHARSSGRLRPRRSRRLTARGSRLWRKFGVQRFWVRPACGLPVLDG